MVLSRDDSPVEGGANLTPASVPDIARSLRLARERAELTVAEAAARAGLGNAVVEDLESGNVGQQHDRIATLRSLRTYADSLGLPGSDYVLVAVEQWPSIGPVLTTGNETAVVPVVSISSAPAGGHSPPGGHGSVWPGDATGVADATTTGVMETLRPTSVTDTGRLPALDTGRVPVVDTGEVAAVNLGVPRLLKFMVGLVAFLVVLAGAALVERNHINGWFDSGRHTTTHWIDDAKSALGITSTPSGHGHHATTTPTHGGQGGRRLQGDHEGRPRGAVGEHLRRRHVVHREGRWPTKGPCWVEREHGARAHTAFRAGPCCPARATSSW